MLKIYGIWRQLTPSVGGVSEHARILESTRDGGCTHKGRRASHSCAATVKIASQACCTHLLCMQEAERAEEGRAGTADWGADGIPTALDRECWLQNGEWQFEAFAC